jgi:cytochrome c oxidase subunit 2
MIERYVEAVSTYASDIDGMILLITVVVGVWFVLWEGLLFGMVFRFRRREGQRAAFISGASWSESRWILIPLALVVLCDIVIAVQDAPLWTHVKQTLPEADRTVRVIGQQWAWTFEHPGPDGKLDTADDVVKVDELHVEVGKTYHFLLESRDTLHSFSVPVFRLKQDAIPGRIITGWFQATKTGTYDVQCAEICGIGHGMMAARIFIETPEQHAAWLGLPAPTRLAAAGLR